MNSTPKAPLKPPVSGVAERASPYAVEEPPRDPPPRNAAPQVYDPFLGTGGTMLVGLGERIVFARKQRGLESNAALARALDLPSGVVRQHIMRNTIPREHILRYVSVLDTPVEWLLEGRGPQPKPNKIDLILSNPPYSAAAVAVGKTTPAPNAVPAPVTPDELVGARDLPVYGAAQGGEGITVDPHPIEWVKRPAPLLSVPKGFAVYVVGDSMSPAYEQGDMVFVHPGLPLAKGDDALLAEIPEAGGEWNAIVKRVLGWTDSAWKLRQYAPARDFDVARAKFPRAFRIVGKYNRR
jgi:phage repressor protein C with HTH and peptisase S24 domain